MGLWKLRRGRQDSEKWVWGSEGCGCSLGGKSRRLSWNQAVKAAELTLVSCYVRDQY